MADLWSAGEEPEEEGAQYLLECDAGAEFAGDGRSHLPERG